MNIDTKFLSVFGNIVSEIVSSALDEALAEGFIIQEQGNKIASLVGRYAAHAAVAIALRAATKAVPFDGQAA